MFGFIDCSPIRQGLVIVVGTCLVILASYGLIDSVLSEHAHTEVIFILLLIGPALYLPAMAFRSHAEDKKRSERIIERQNRHMNVVLENMTQGLCMFDAHARLMVCNELYASIYGLTPEMVAPGTPLKEIIKHRIAKGVYAGATPEEYGQEREDWAREPSSQSRTDEFNDGRVFAITKKPLLNGGWVSTHEDITERVRIEAELKEHRDVLQAKVDEATTELRIRAEKLEKALAKEKQLNELQRQFVSMTSHEFRTPLAVIDMSVQRMLRQKDRIVADDLEARGNKIRAAVKTMTMLMESTLSAARMDAGKIDINIQECDLTGIISDVCDHQSEINDEFKIVCHLKDLPDVISGDRAALEQVFTNLLCNAIKYSPGGPDITVKGWCEGDDAVVSIQDHGLGIDEDDLPQMFSRFFRAETSIGIPGTGIGLNLVKLMVEMHGGSVDLESKKGAGSTFTVRLPIAGSPVSEQEQERTTTNAA